MPSTNPAAIARAEARIADRASELAALIGGQCDCDREGPIAELGAARLRPILRSFRWEAECDGDHEAELAGTNAASEWARGHADCE